jgi:hypothetical protein
MQGVIFRKRKAYVSVTVGSTKTNTATIIHIQVPVGKKLKDIISQ